MPSDPTKVYAEPIAPLPAYLAPFTDPTFGTTVTRITGVTGATFPTSLETGVWSIDARHHYAKDEPWNADGTLIAIDNEGGSPERVYLDAESYAVRYETCYPHRYGDDRWHPSPAHAHERISVAGSELAWIDVVDCRKTRTWSLPFTVHGFGAAEGNPSDDGRFVALFDDTLVFVVDMDPQSPLLPYPAQRIGPAFPLNHCGLTDCSVDWVSISPSGKYVVIKYTGEHMRVLDVNPITLALTPRPMPAASPRCFGTADQGFVYDLGHLDMTRNPFDGHEDVMVGQDHCDNIGRTLNGQLMGGVVMVRLRDGRVTTLTSPVNEAYPHHVSCRNLQRPGWAYVTYFPEPGKRFSNEIVAVKLDGSQAVQRLVHNHTDFTNCYRCEAHGVPSPDGRRVLWASNWALSCSACGAASDIKAYVADARARVDGSTIAAAPCVAIADASRSTDADGGIVSYRFDFGDGSTAGPQVSPFAPHTYKAGRWTMRVTVTDNAGATATTAQDIVVPDTAGTAAAPPSPNLVGNPSFETDLAGWSAYGPATIARVAGGQDGGSCVRASGPVALTSFGINDSPDWVSKVPAAGTRYRVTAWVRALGLLGTCRLQVREWLNGVEQGATVYSPPVRLGLLWQMVTVDRVASQAGSTLDVQVLDAPLFSSESFYVDNVSIGVVPFTAPLASPEEPNAIELAPHVSPNPMAGRGVIDFATARPGALRVALFDAAGRRVRLLVDRPSAPAGASRVGIDGRDDAGAPLQAGLYFYRIESASGRAGGRFVIVR